MAARSQRRHVVATAALGTVAALILSACGSSSTNSGSSGGSASGGSGGSSNPAASDTSTTGVTSSSITLGTTQPLTGPAAPGYSKISAAMNAYFQFANAQGGVNGRKVTLKVMDDGYNPATTATDTRQLVLQDKVFALIGALGTPTHTAVLDFVNQNKVPDLFVASGSRSWNQPSKYPETSGWQPDYTKEGKVLGQYIKDNFGGKKVCSFGQNDDFGTDGVQGIEQTLGSGSLASKQTYSPTNTNVGPQLGALQAAGCQVVVSFTVPGFTALEMGGAAKLNFHPQFVVSNVGSDLPTLATLLKDATGPLTEGMVSDSYLPVYSDTSNSWIQLFQKVNAQYNGNAPFDGNVEYGMAEAYTFLQVLKSAGQNLTRGSLITALEKGGFTGPGIVPLTYSGTDHSGFAGVQVAVVKNGVPTLTGQPLTTDDGSGPLTPYTTQQPTAPSNGLPQ